MAPTYYPVQSLIKSVAIMDILADSMEGMRITEISEKTGMNKSMVHRILTTLVHERYVDQDVRKGCYRLSFKLFEIARRILNNVRTTKVAAPFLEKLAEETGESARLIAPDYDADTTYNFDPSSAWDDYEQVGLSKPGRPTHWFFISYPTRKQVVIDSSETIAWLFDYTVNPLFIVKDDEGRWYIEDSTRSNLDYLEPGRGYYLGFEDDTTVYDCPWFTNEGYVPAGVAPDPKETISITGSGPHFQYKAKTHWWYPIQIDTIAVSGASPDEGDEIGVFDDDLCVGAQTFDGEYPIQLAAWMDDIATPDEVDGYYPSNDMTFVWFDVSANQEITFNAPPGIYSTQPEADPMWPTHSGFGVGFCAVRSLDDGVNSVLQLPLEYKLNQNFPNPFNAQTVIPLELPQRSLVKIELFNILGRNVGVIYEGIENAGWAQVRYNARNLPSGVYFYFITAEGLERGGKFQDIRKMVLVK